jgi:FkbM family methyltransferase
MGYRISYVDLLTVAPQWKDTFVDEIHVFRAATEAPRIFDCGANVGIVTLYLKRMYPAARITAFEADPRIAEALSRTVAQNHLSGVDIVSSAVWDEPGQVSFVAEGADSGGIASEYRGGADRLISVPTVRLRDLIAAEEQIDLLKLDVEGAEHRVLADCEPELERVGAIALELHDFDPGCRRNAATRDLLSRAGFQYAHGGVVAVPSPDTDIILRSPFPAGAVRWVERIYAWRE